MKNKTIVCSFLVLLTASNAKAQTQPGTLLPPSLPPQPIAVGDQASPPPSSQQPIPSQPVLPQPGPPLRFEDPQHIDPLQAPLPGRGAIQMENQRGAWVTLDYLLWWVKPGPLPAPLVTIGSVNDNIPGALGEPGTAVLFGDRNMDFGALSGLRFDAGWWLPPCPIFAIQGGFFVLQQGTKHFSAFSDPDGSPVLARPFINAQSNTESSYIDSMPGLANGGVSARSTTQVNGWEINGVANMLHRTNFEWDFLIGFRALNLNENLEIGDTLVPFSAGNFAFQGGPADPPSIIADFDRFRTSNHFYGGQIGSKVNWWCGPIDFNCTAKVALGTTQQIITVDGGSLLITPGSGAIGVPGGVLAQQTNIGRYYHSEFSVVPEAGFNIGWQFTPCARLQLGYTLIYWSNVARPGNQIDRTINPSQVPTDNTFGTLIGPGRPILVPHSSDFWTQGLNLGLEFRF